MFAIVFHQYWKNKKICILFWFLGIGTRCFLVDREGYLILHPALLRPKGEYFGVQSYIPRSLNTIFPSFIILPEFSLNHKKGVMTYRLLFSIFFLKFLGLGDFFEEKIRKYPMPSFPCHTEGSQSFSMTRISFSIYLVIYNEQPGIMYTLRVTV